LHSARTGELKVEGRAMIVHRRTSYIDGLKQVRKRARLSGKACYVWVRLLVPPSGLERKSVEAHVAVRKFEGESEDSAGEDGQTWAEELANHMASISARKLHRIVAEKQATPRTPMEQRIQADEYIRIRESFLKLFTTWPWASISARKKARMTVLEPGIPQIRATFHRQC
jgi:hypothetical protein